MLELDIIYVTYNSEKWIDRCFKSVLESDYDLSKVSIYVVDNASQDKTIVSLSRVKDECSERAKKFEIILSEKNLGFGKGNNLGFRAGDSSIVCFFNIDTEIYPDTLKNLVADIENSDQQCGLWELRQFPYEHPKMYDPLTHETAWSSGAAFAMRRDLFEQLHGFDEKIFMYAEDVDLSWRIRSYGYYLKYVPNAVINHYSYQNAGEIKPNQYLNSVVNNLMLRYRFGTQHDIRVGHEMIWKQFMLPAVFPRSKRLLMKKYLNALRDIPYFKSKKRLGNDKNFNPEFHGFDYSAIRDGAFYINHFPKENPLVSIIVRTCGRPDVLRETLISLRQQTYPNVEVVVVEDGEEKAGQMIRQEFADMNIIYHATGDKVGRSRAGNWAMELAHGKYLNFLDDDDLFYADHIEVLVSAIESAKEKAVYAFGFATPIEIYSKSPYQYKVLDYLGVHKQNYNKFMLCHHNYIPIQCIMFEKSLFEEYGGLDETLDALEDWDLWVRYSLHTDFLCVPKTTSIYRIPGDKEIDKKRQKDLDDALLIVREKHKTYQQTMSVYDFAKLYEDGAFR